MVNRYPLINETHPDGNRATRRAEESRRIHAPVQDSYMRIRGADTEAGKTRQRNMWARGEANHERALARKGVKRGWFSRRASKAVRIINQRQAARRTRREKFAKRTV